MIGICLLILYIEGGENMLKIDTGRLYILPLHQTNLECGINNFEELEQTLDLFVSNKELSERQKSVWRIRLNGIKSDPLNYMWYTVWIIVLKESNQMIGTIMLKGYPNENGEVIVGYAIDEEFRDNGYMTEALNNITMWMFLNPDVKCVVADTVKTNIPSQKVIKKIGMICYKEDDECFWWKLER